MRTLSSRPSSAARLLSGTALALTLAATGAGCSAPPEEQQSSSSATGAAPEPQNAEASEHGSSAPGTHESGSADPPAPSSSGDATDTTEPNFPMRKLKPGETPPQFILFSFDGGGMHERWDSFLAAAEETDSRFTVYLAGLFLVELENREAYQGPAHAPGESDNDFAPDVEFVSTMIDDLNRAHRGGHEIGTHYNGHFCSVDAYGIDQWTTQDWVEEMEIFHRIVDDPETFNGYPEGTLPELELEPEDIVGTRTPCLQGRWDQMTPMWKEAGITYDTSQTSQRGVGLQWPYVKDGIWEFEMQTVNSPAFSGPDSLARSGDDSPAVMAMDYSFWAKTNNLKDEPADAPRLKQATLETYRYMYDSAFAGNRAPLVIGNHLNDWSGNAFNSATEEFMRETCGEPDTHCVTYKDLIEWLELQDPEVLSSWQEQEPSGLGDDVAELGY